MTVPCCFFGSWLVRWWVDPLRRPILAVVGEAVCGCLGLDSCWPRVQSVGFDPSCCGCRARPFNHPVTVEVVSFVPAAVGDCEKGGQAGASADIGALDCVRCLVGTLHWSAIAVLQVRKGVSVGASHLGAVQCPLDYLCSVRYS